MVFITEFEQKEHEIRNELFAIHMKLKALSPKEGNPLYAEEIRNLRQELKTTRHKLARLEAEEKGLIEVKKEGR